MDTRPTIIRFFVIAAAFVIVVAGMYAASSLIVPFLLAGFLAVVLTPPMRLLQQRCRLPLGVALLVVVLLAAGLAAGGVALVSRPIADLTASVPDMSKGLQFQAGRLSEWLAARDVNVGDMDEWQTRGTQAITDFVTAMLQGLGGLLSDTLVIFVLMIFMLMEAARFPAKLRSGLGEDNPTMQRITEIVASIRKYMLIKSGASLLTGVLVTIILMILGVQYALVWGVLAFLLNFVPNIGSILAAVPAVVMALVQPEAGQLAAGVPLAAATATTFLAVNLVIAYVIEPRFTSRGLGLSTLTVIVSLVFWGWVLGPVGMLLSAPLTMSIKIVLEGFEETRWAAVLMGR
jgi:AI-2 transport protein TqsA